MMKRIAFVLMLWCVVMSRFATSAAALNFPPSDFDIFDTVTAKLIGHGHYVVDTVGDQLFLHGQNRYASGEYDIEEDQLSATPDHPLPELVSFRHDFYNVDGALFIDSRLDKKTGEAVCGRSDNGILDTKSERIEAGADTYAGVSVLLPVQNFLNAPKSDPLLKLHVFSCVPTPKLIAVDIARPAQATVWPNYPGQLEKIDITPNFGFWTVVIQPFIPKLAAWFEPSRDSLLVGAQLQRYYKGPKIILVRSREASLSIDAAAKKSPSVAGVPPPQR